MWPARYFSLRYFAARYWAKVGATPPVVDTPEGLDGNIVRAVSFEVHIG